MKIQPESMQPLVSEVQAGIEQELGSQLIGLYLFGSLVIGDFDEDLSDIDLLAVTESVLSDEKLEGLGLAHEAFVRRHPEWYDRLEVAYMSRSVLQDFKTAQGEVARISPGEDLHRTLTSVHWLADLYTVQEKGVVLHGPPAREVVPYITTEEFKTVARDNLGEWREWLSESKSESFQAYAILTFCRNLYACQTGEQSSKLQGARWAKESYPQYADLIDRALQWRQKRSAVVNEHTYPATAAFLEFAIEQSQRRVAP